MVNFLIIPSFVALGVFFLSRFIGKRFNLSGKMCLLLAILSFASAFIAQNLISPANVPSPPLPIKDEPKLVIISSEEIILSGPGVYFVSAEHMTVPDNIIEKISGLSIGDKVTLQVATNDGEIVIRESNFIRMQAPIFCLRSIDDKITFSNIGDGICVEDSRINIGDGC